MLPSDNTEDELSTTESTESEQQYYNGNDHLPVFRNGLTYGLSTKEIVTSLKAIDVDDKCVAKVVPTAVSHNVAFVVDVTSKFVGHLKNLLSDDMGAWNQTGTKTAYFKCKSGGYEEVTNFRQGEENVFKVVKWYYRNTSSKDLSRIVCHMSGNLGLSSKI